MYRDASDPPAPPVHADAPVGPRPGSGGSATSLDVARRCIDAYNRRDLALLRALAHPDIELDWAESRWLGAGRYSGVDAVLQFYRDHFDTVEQGVVEPHCFVVAGSSVVIPNRARLRGRDGIEVFARSTLAITVAVARVSRVRLHRVAL